jgi:hypothetical protein
LQQAVRFGHVGRSKSWLSQAERGQRSIDNRIVINTLAEILGLPVDELTAKKSTAMARYQAAAVIRRAILA